MIQASLPKFCNGILGAKPVNDNFILASLLSEVLQKQREEGDIGLPFNVPDTWGEAEENAMETKSRMASCFHLAAWKGE